MADDADAAHARETAHRESALLRHRVRNAGAGGRVDCEDCGDDIPERRRKALPQCRRCVECQEIFERRSRFFKGT